VSAAEVRSIELLDEPPFGESARARFGAGTANACTPPEAYDENAFALEGFALREGDLLRWGQMPEPEAEGDLDRDADANGDLDPEKDSKPALLTGVPVSVGFVVDVDNSPRTGEKGDVADCAGDFVEKSDGEDVLPEENTFCPLTDAKGEVEAA
jgi:hypothetical protein